MIVVFYLIRSVLTISTFILFKSLESEVFSFEINVSIIRTTIKV